MPYKIQSLAGEPYRPSNGTEGMMFQAHFCDKCVHESEESPCELITLSMVYDTRDKEYPKEWTHNEGGEPVCTKFTEGGS